MSQFAIDQVLAQMRVLTAQAKGLPAPISGAGESGQAAAAAGPGFASLLQQSLQQVNQTQKSADSLAAAFERGTPGIELPQVMLEMEKANVSFQAVNQVRNRLVSAYQDIMNMQI